MGTRRLPALLAFLLCSFYPSILLATSMRRISAYPRPPSPPGATFGEKLTARKVPSKRTPDSNPRFVRTPSGIRVDPVDLPRVDSRLVERNKWRDSEEPIGPPLTLSNTTVRSLFNYFEGIGPPGGVSPPGAIFAPAPPHLGFGVTAPSPPITPSSPAPPTVTDDTSVSDIRCMDIENSETFSALLTLPRGFTAIPVFEDRPSVDPTNDLNCRLTPVQPTREFRLNVTSLETCGVRRCTQSDGQKWLCLTLRYPVITGLKLPEDELVEIRCRPQDKTADNIKVLSVKTANALDRQLSVFEGGVQQDFQCEIALFRKLPGTTEFTKRLPAHATLDLGEEIQLRSIVKSGDGWHFSRLEQVIVQKVSNNQGRSPFKSTAVLVLNNGCRNPAYKAIAPHHPQRSTTRLLMNEFTFRVFIFQDMEIGESLMISARVIGCVEQSDCQPTMCDDEDNGYKLGFGKRKKREVKDVHMNVSYPAKGKYYYSESLFDTYSNRTANWDRDLAIRVKLPGSELGADLVSKSECRLYLLITLGVSISFFIISVAFVVFSMIRNKHKKTISENLQFFASNLSAMKSSGNVSSYPGSRVPEVSIESATPGQDGFSVSSVLQDFSVPATVRQRKKQMHIELLKTFQPDPSLTYTGYPPSMYNYYGYMVLPRRLNEQGERRGPKVPKKAGGRKEEFLNSLKDPSSSSSSSWCPATSEVEVETSTSDEDAYSGATHKSVIHVSGNETYQVEQNKPRPLPRAHILSDHVYSEIQSGITPTLV